MLIGNGRLTDKVPMTFLGRDWNAQLQPGALPAVTQSENFGALAGLPSGYYQPHGWMLPRKGGNLRAGTLAGSGAVSAGTLQSGYNIAGTISGDGGISNAPLGLIVSIAAALVASGGISSAATEALAAMVADLTGSGDLAATAKGLADLGAQLAGSGAAVGGNTALMDIGAQIRGYGDLTPEGIRDAVWNAILANYPTAGTAGKALSLASSGGVDLNALAAAVWTYAIENAMSAEQMMRILLAALAGTSERTGNTVTFTSPVDGSTIRITGSFDAQNNRTGVILDGD